MVLEFLLLQRISPLRRRGGGFAIAPSTPSQRTPMFLEFLCCRANYLKEIEKLKQENFSEPLAIARIVMYNQ